eukprot:Pgem_evm1s18165
MQFQQFAFGLLNAAIVVHTATVETCVSKKCVKVENGVLKIGDDQDTQVCKDFEKCNLSKLGIKTIEFDTFHKLQKLTQITLSENEIEKLEDDTFANAITFLELNDNKLSNVSEKVFKNMWLLKNIRLEKNKFSAFPENLFIKNGNLESVSLFYNAELTSLPSKIFSNNTKLKTVDASNCKITQFPEDLFAKNTALESVKLGGNSMCGQKTIPEALFANNLELKDIFLDNMEIEKLPVKLLEKTTKLTAFRFNNNQNLKVLPVGFLDYFNFPNINGANGLDFGGCTRLTKLDQSYKTNFESPVSGIFVQGIKFDNSLNTYFDCDENECTNGQTCLINSPVDAQTGKFACPSGSSLSSSIQTSRINGACDGSISTGGNASTMHLSASLIASSI